MMKAGLLAGIVFLFVGGGCDDSSVDTQPEPPTAQYVLTFEAAWSADTHPTDFPRAPHFSGLIGATHVSAIRLWEAGGGSTPGLKDVAETGSKSRMSDEIDTLISDGSVCLKLSGGGIGVSPGEVELDFNMSQDCPAVSIVSMIAPSPDWFVGVSALHLFENGKWVDQKVIDLFPYDAGTDSGVTFTSPNEPTLPWEAIQRIEGEPFLNNGSVLPLGTFTFTRIENP
jgi:hypothetical protein